MKGVIYISDLSYMLLNMLEFKVNDCITLKLEEDKTIIYINGQIFQQCKFLLLNIPVNKISSLNEIESIDEAAEELDKSLEPIHENINTIPPEIEFWGHCSNLQVWYEKKYDTRLLHSNLAFPLLKRLTDVGDPLARQVFKEEIAKRIESGFPSVVQYLVLEGYLDYLNDEEFDYIIRSPKLINDLINCCYKDEEDEYQFEGLYYLLKKLKTVNNQYFKELMRILLRRNDFRINYFLDRENLTCEISKKELAYLLLEKNEAKAILKLGELMYDKYDEFDISISPRPARVCVKDKHVIELSLNYFGLKHIPNNILKLEKLEYLYLVGNKISKIPNFICKMKHLTNLIVSENNISKIPVKICNLRNLKRISLSENNISKIPVEICNLRNLKRISLSENNISKIPVEICNLRNLRVLNLSENKITKIPQCIDKLESLEYFIIYNNNLSSLPETILNLKNLKRINLSENKITKIPQCIDKLESLEYFIIYNNNLSSLPETILNLKNLKELDCSQNPTIKISESIKRKKDFYLIF